MPLLWKFVMGAELNLFYLGPSLVRAFMPSETRAAHTAASWAGARDPNSSLVKTMANQSSLTPLTAAATSPNAMSSCESDCKAPASFSTFTTWHPNHPNHHKLLSKDYYQQEK